jgi:hypothetical protein
VVRDDGVLGVSVHCGNILDNGNGMRTGGDSRGGLHVNVGSCVIGTIKGSAFGGETGMEVLAGAVSKGVEVLDDVEIMASGGELSAGIRSLEQESCTGCAPRLHGMNVSSLCLGCTALGRRQFYNGLAKIWRKSAFPALLNLQGTPLGGPNNNNDCQVDTTNTTFLRIAPTPSSELTVGTAATSRCGRD